MTRSDDSSDDSSEESDESDDSSDDNDDSDDSSDDSADFPNDYLGCFADKSGDRALDEYKWTDSDSMTIEVSCCCLRHKYPDCYNSNPSIAPAARHSPYEIS